MLNSITWNHLTVQKMINIMFDSNTWNHVVMSKQMNSKNSFENKATYKLFACKIIYIYVCVCVRMFWH